jgi:hypothetical protein
MIDLKINLPVMNQMTLLQYEYDLAICLTYTYFFEVKNPKNWTELDYNIYIIKLRQEIKILQYGLKYTREREAMDMLTLASKTGMLMWQRNNMQVRKDNKYLISIDPIV